MAAKKNNYYAYVVPGSAGGSEKSGITTDWKSCEKIVSGKYGARYKGFVMKADAEAWLNAGARYESKEAKPQPKLKPGIYFDAGTGRGDGVEISVTDEHGKNLLHQVAQKIQLNRFGKHLLGSDATNNYGELLALKYALEIARLTDVKDIFGDSKLVIDYWSQWKMKRKELPEETVVLAEQVSKMRDIFENDGGSVERISGDYNPADLGFH